MKQVVPLAIAALVLGALAASADPPATAPHPTSLTVLPFVGSTEAEKTLAEKMRFAVSAKMSRDGNFDRKDNVEVEQIVSALQIPWGTAGRLPGDDEIKQAIAACGTDMTVLGQVVGRQLTLRRYDGAQLVKTATVEIPGPKDSPKLAVEQIVTELAGVKFAHIREVECDHSDPAVERLWAARPNLVLDPGFEDAAKTNQPAAHWGAILGPNRWPPKLTTAAEAKKLPPDSVAIVPKAAADDATDAAGHCLMMRMSKTTAENNGLACESIWIPVEHGQKYRFTCQYHSTGPTPRLFLKGFAVKADQFGSKEDPEAVRREFYRCQVLPRKANAGWEPIEIDFTPSVVQEGRGEGGSTARGMKIEWLRVDLYIYLKPGDVFFDNIDVRKISQ